MPLNIDSVYRSGTYLKQNQTDHGTESYESLGDVFFKCMKKYSNKIAQYLPESEEIDTFGELLSRCIRIALKLKDKGMTNNDIISACTNNHKNSVVPFIAAMLLGAKIVNFDPMSFTDNTHLVKLVKPKIIFVSIETLPRMEKCIMDSKLNVEIVVFGRNEKYDNFFDYLDFGSDNDVHNFKPAKIDNIKDTAAIMFSSGTTGVPKGICLNHYSLIEQYAKIQLGDGRSQEIVTLIYTSLYWLSAVVYLIASTFRGYARVICSSFDPVRARKLIEKYKVTYMFAAPYLASQFLNEQSNNSDTSSLEVLLIGGYAVTANLMNGLRTIFPHSNIVNGYGQTEVGFLTGFDIRNPADRELQIKKPQSCGKINPTLISWKIVDPVTEEKLGRNQRGELRIKSKYVMNGYYNMDTSYAFDSEGFLKTGDIVYYDDEDCFYVVDRIKEMFKYKSLHIVPVILEEILVSHPAVKEAVVIGLPHSLDGDRPMGIVVLNEGYEKVTPKEIEDYVAERVADHQRLRAGVRFVKELCRTSTSKVRRNHMRQMVIEGKI